MASYKIRCTADQKEYEIHVGVFRGKTYNISGAEYSPDFPNSVAWSTESLPIFYSRGTDILDLADFDYWVQNEFEFVNDTRYKLQFTESNVSGTSYPLYRYTPMGGGSYALVGNTTIRALTADILIGRYTARFLYQSAYFNATDLAEVGQELSDGQIQVGFSSIGSYAYHPHSTILYDSEHHTFITGSFLHPLTIFGTNKNNANYNDGGTSYIVEKCPLPEKAVIRDLYLPSNPPTIAYKSGEQTPYLYFGGKTTLTYGDYGVKLIPNYQLNYLATGTAYMYYPYDGSSMQLRPLTELLWYLLYNKYEPQDDPIPDTEKPDDSDPSGNSPPWTGGGGEQDKGSDDIKIPNLPDINLTNTGVVELYKMTTGTLRNLYSYLWTNAGFTAIAKLFSNPMDAVLSLKMFPFYIPTVRDDNIVIGNVTTTVQAGIINTTFMSLDFGSINLKPYYNDASDYVGTSLSVYLPFIGYRSVNVNDFMSATITLQYNIDLLTGVFVAILKVQKEVNGTSLNSVLQQFNGLLSYDIPLSSVDASAITQSLINLTASFAVGGVTGAASGAVSALSHSSIRQENVGSISANHGFLGVFEPHLIISRPIYAQPPNFSHYVGYPYEGYQVLGDVKGYTVLRQVFIDDVIGTPEETEMIRQALLSGVIL